MLVPTSTKPPAWASCLLLAAAGYFGVVGAEEPPVVSSRDLLGDPVEVASAPLEYVKADASCEGRLEIGEAVISRPDGHFTVRFRLTNICENAARADVQSAFIRSDGSVVETPYPRPLNALEGMTRGFVGLISLGASEIAMELESAEPTIATEHTLEPGKSVIVEHQLPYVSADVVGVRAFVSTARGGSDKDHADEVRRSLDEQYWKARDHYFTKRKDENLRWDKQRELLDSEKADLPPLGVDYKGAMSRYWGEHRKHLARLQEIEEEFEEFRKHQKRHLQVETTE